MKHFANIARLDNFLIIVCPEYLAAVNALPAHQANLVLLLVINADLESLGSQDSVITVQKEPIVTSMARLVALNALQERILYRVL